MTKDEIIEMARQALEGLFGTAEQFEGGGVAVWRLGGSAQPKQAIAALRLAIDAQNMASELTYKQQTQEPVAWPCLIDSADFSENTITLVMQCEDYKVSAGTHYLSTTPPQRTWVGLTEKEVEDYWDWEDFQCGAGRSTILEMVRDIEAKLKEKNT